MSKFYIYIHHFISILYQIPNPANKTNGVFTPEQDNDKRTTRERQENDKTNVEPVHSYDAFHTRVVGPGVKGIIGMHRFNICLVVVLSVSCSGVKTPLVVLTAYLLRGRS